MGTVAALMVLVDLVLIAVAIGLGAGISAIAGVVPIFFNAIGFYLACCLWGAIIGAALGPIGYLVRRGRTLGRLPAASSSAAHMETRNLRLVPHLPKHLRALIDGPVAYDQSLGLRPATGLKNFVIAPAVSPDFLAQIYDSNAPNPWTHGFALVHVAARTVIGIGRFNAPPGPDGVVELVYGIAPDFEDKGYAAEAVQALVAYACDNPQVRIVQTHTRPEPDASTLVLADCGFRRVGEIIDLEGRPVWRWEHSKDPA